MPKKQEHSPIWKHFSKSQDLQNKAICKYCKADVSRGGQNALAKGFTTTNMWHHMRRSHPKELDKPVMEPQQCNPCSETDDGASSSKKQCTIDTMFEKKSPIYFVPEDPRAIEITKLVAEEICLDLEPLDHVNKIGFRRLLAKLCPRYKIVSRTHLTDKIIPSMYDAVKSKIKVILEDIQYLCLTSDIWSSSSSSNMNDFISITAHGLDTEFQPKSFCLEVFPFEGVSHTSENIAHNIHMIMLSWGITERVKTITTDNARNMTSAVNELNSMSEHTNYQHIGCNAHKLQLVINNGLLERETIKELVVTAKKIVGHFSHSTTSMKLLKEEQERFNLPDHVLIQDVTTRWDSTFQMLQRLSEQRVAIQTVLPKVNCQHDLSSLQWSKINSIVEILQYFEEATKTLSKSDVTLSVVIPLVNSICQVLYDTNNNETLSESIRGLAEDLLTEMKARYGDLENNMMYASATVLDPRYKGRIFKSNYAVECVKEKLCQEMQLNDSAANHTSGTSANLRVTPGPSTSKTNIWNVCQQMISDKEFEEPLSNFLNSEFLSLHS